MTTELRGVERHGDRLSFEVWVDGEPWGLGDLWPDDDGAVGGSGRWLESERVVAEVERLASAEWAKER